MRHDVQHLFDTRGPVSSRVTVEDVVWSSRFRVHHRLADHYRSGRMLLAGDAAHVHSPAGGQGMNTGLQDGIVLGQRLNDVLSGRAHDAALDDYETVRRPVAARVVAFTDRLTRMATLRTPVGRAIRNTAMVVVSRVVPEAPAWLATELAGLHNR